MLPGRGGLTQALVLAALLAAGCSLEEPTAPPAPSTSADLSKASPAVTGNWVSTPRLFAQGVLLGTVAATPGRILASTLGDAPTKLVNVTESGDMEPFAPGFTGPPMTPCAIEIASGYGAFEQGGIFVGLGSEVSLLAPDGSAETVFASIPAAEGEITALFFDPVGAFGHDLLVLARSGAVFRIDVQSRVVRIGSFGPGAQGPAIAPSRFGTQAGRILAAFPGASEVRAMDAAGSVSLFLKWSGAAGVVAIPDEPRAFGATGGAFFIATAAGQVFRFPLGDLAARGGELVVTSLYRSGSGLVTTEGGMLRTRAFSRSFGPEIAAAGVRRPAITPVTVELFPGSPSKVLTVGSTELVPVGVYASIGFNPASLVGGEIALAGAQPVASRTRLGTSVDLDGDGRLDLVLQFRPSEMTLAPGDALLTLDGSAIDGDRVRGHGRALVLVP